jgi:hypothetical protein
MPKLCLAALCAVSLAFGVVFFYALGGETINGIGPLALFGSHRDFLAFYSVAHLVLHGGTTQIYSSTTLLQLQHAIVHGYTGIAGYMPFLNPPFAAVLLAPLALVAEPTSRAIWLALNLTLAVGLSYYLVSQLQLQESWQKLLAVLLLLCTFPMYENLVEGQLSLIILAGGCLALAHANRQRPWFSGAWLGVLWLKPQLAILAILALLLARQWRVVGGMVAAGLAVALLALPITGVAIYGSYIRYLIHVLGAHFNGGGAINAGVWEGNIGGMIGVNGFLASAVGQNSINLVNALTATFDAILVIGYLGVAYRATSRNAIIAAGILVGLLIDPHLYRQDIVLLYLLIPLLARRLERPLLVIALSAALLNLLILDVFPLHSFTALLFVGTLWFCLNNSTVRLHER